MFWQIFWKLSVLYSDRLHTGHYSELYFSWESVRDPITRYCPVDYAFTAAHRTTQASNYFYNWRRVKCVVEHRLLPMELYSVDLDSWRCSWLCLRYAAVQCNNGHSWQGSRIISNEGDWKRERERETHTDSSHLRNDLKKRAARLHCWHFHFVCDSREESRHSIALAVTIQRISTHPNARPSVQSQEIQVQIVQGCHRDVICRAWTLSFEKSR